MGRIDNEDTEDVEPRGLLHLFSPSLSHLDFVAMVLTRAVAM